MTATIPHPPPGAAPFEVASWERAIGRDVEHYRNKGITRQALEKRFGRPAAELVALAEDRFPKRGRKRAA